MCVLGKMERCVSLGRSLVPGKISAAESTAVAEVSVKLSGLPKFTVDAPNLMFPPFNLYMPENRSYLEPVSVQWHLSS